MISKKGSDKVVSVYWFVILAITAGGIFAMVYSFYGAPYDVREIEVSVLNNKIADCVSREGKLNSNLILNNNFSDDFEENVLENCDLIFDTEKEFDWEIERQYFFEVEFYSLENLDSSLFLISEGNLNFKQDCFIENKKGEDYEKLVKCEEKRFYSLDENDNQYLIKILSGVRKSEKNVKQ